MLLIQWVITAVLSLSICVVSDRRLSANRIQSTSPRRAMQKTGQLIGAMATTLACLWLVKWVAIHSLLAIVLLQLAMALYLAHLACGAVLRQHSARHGQQQNDTHPHVITRVLRSTFLAPAGLCSFGLLSLFISTQQVSWRFILSIALIHIAIIGVHTLAPLRQHSEDNLSSGTARWKTIILRMACVTLLASSVCIAGRSILHLY